MIWALIDDRAGNAGQVIGVSEAIGKAYQKKDIIYNSFIKLPNLLRGTSLIGLKNKDNLLPPYPELVISAGRRCAPIARYIKKFNSKTKLVQIMSPDFGHEDFDLIIMPEHDNYKPQANIITTIGSLHKLTDSLLQHEANQWQEKFSHLKKPYIVLLVGGSSKNGKFTSDHAKELGILANNLAKKTGGSLLITSSRRTGDEQRVILEQQLYVPYNFYYFGATGPNPYLGYLALADYIIVTGDSVAMASEACFTGKPVYIYSPDNITGNKHRKFQQQLFTKNLAKPLMSNEPLIDFVPDNRLDETSRIANYINHHIL
jgi:mitochondrial fission protein ELM1